MVVEGYCNKAGYCNKQTIHSQSKPPSPKYIQTYRGKTKNGLDKGRNKRLYGAISIAESISQTGV